MMNETPLGKSTEYTDQYDQDSLFPIARAENRESFGLATELPFGSCELWTAREITWLGTAGIPVRIALTRIQVCARPKSADLDVSPFPSNYEGTPAPARLPRQ